MIVSVQKDREFLCLCCFPPPQVLQNMQTGVTDTIVCQTCPIAIIATHRGYTVDTTAERVWQTQITVFEKRNWRSHHLSSFMFVEKLLLFGSAWVSRQPRKDSPHSCQLPSSHAPSGTRGGCSFCHTVKDPFRPTHLQSNQRCQITKYKYLPSAQF